MNTNIRLKTIADVFGITIDEVYKFESRCVAAGVTTIWWEFLEVEDIIGLPYWDEDGVMQRAEPIV